METTTPGRSNGADPQAGALHIEAIRAARVPRPRGAGKGHPYSAAQRRTFAKALKKWPGSVAALALRLGVPVGVLYGMSKKKPKAKARRAKPKPRAAGGVREALIYIGQALDLSTERAVKARLMLALEELEK